MLKSLIRIRLTSAFGRLTVGKNGAKASVGRMIAMIFVYLYLAATFLFVSFSVAVSLAPVLIYMELDWLFFTLFFLATFSIILLFGIFEVKSELFDAKDNDLLIPLPIAARDIFLSRLLTVLIYNYIEGAIVLFPAIGVYLAFGGGIAGLFGGLLGFLIFPLLATAISAFLGYALAFVSARVKNRSAVTVVLTVLFLVLYFWGYNAMMQGLDAVFEDMSAVGASLAAKLSFLRFIGELGTLSSLSSVLLVLGACGLVVTLSYLWLSKNYFALAKITPVTAGVSKKAARISERTSPVRSLAKKELSRFLSSGTYITNTAIGLLFELFLAGALLLKGRELIVMLIAELGLSVDGVALLALGVLLSLVPMTYISAPALSLEGKSLWILKSLPLSARDVLTGKLLPHVTVSAPFHLVASVLMIVALVPSLPMALLLLLLPQLASVGYGAFGLFLNTLFPRFNYENEAQPIKQSLPVLLSSIAPTFLSFGLMVGLFFLVLLGWTLLASLLLLLLSLLGCAIALVLLYTVGARRYEKC